MTAWLPGLSTLAQKVLAAPMGHRRRLVAIVGAPGSGKSTLAEALAAELCGQGHATAVVPMDGFHLDNRLIEPRGLLPRKGSPETFDAAGFGRLAQALASEETVYYPLFDRSRDCAIAGAGMLDAACETVVLEGNYLLLNRPEWSPLRAFWDLTISLSVPLEVLESRLIDRWRHHGLPDEAARARALGNDIPNARAVLAESAAADIVVHADEG
jgi:pantothenate kinase